MIETTRLTIRPWTLEDAPAFFDLTQDDGFNFYPITIYRQTSIESSEDWIRENKGKYAVIEKDTGKIIGMGGLSPWEWEGETLIDITYRLRESAWGKGYGLELAQALKNYAFKELDLKEITATITPDNLQSKKIADKLGMKYDRRIVLLGVLTDLYRLQQ